MTFAFVPPTDSRRLTQLRMALLLRLRRSIQRAGASVRGLQARGATVARSAPSVVSTVRRRVHNTVRNRLGWLLDSVQLLRQALGRIADLVSQLWAGRVVRPAIRLVQRLADSRVTAGLMRGADAARSVLVVRLGILALKGLRAKARTLVTGLVVASALLVRLTRFGTAKLFSAKGDVLSSEEQIATDCDAARSAPAEGRLTGEELDGIYEAMLTLEAALPETNVLLDGAEHTWVPEAVVLAEEVLRRCHDECLHLRELVHELTPADGVAVAKVEQQLKADIEQLLQRVEPQLRTLEARLHGTEKTTADAPQNRAQRRAAERTRARKGVSSHNGIRA